MTQSCSPLRFKDIVDGTRLFRYISLAQFLSLVEEKQLHLSKIDTWDDTWEGALFKVPTQIDNNKLQSPLYTIGDDMFGQCWSLFKDSDAMWRIYSSNSEGLMIGTTAKKFRSVVYTSPAVLGKVTYIDYGKSEIPESSSMFDPALIKRKAFEHEHEVRLLTVSSKSSSKKVIYLDIDPYDFIEEIVIDPRASEWFVKVVVDYCKRAGFSITVSKSSLYAFDPLSVGIIKKYVKVEN